MKLSPDDFEMSPLAAYGLIAIGLIIGVLGLEKFASIESALEQEVISAQTEFATLTTIKDTSYWTERLAQSTVAREQLQSAIWTGNTSGVIAAELQQALRALAAQNNFSQTQVRVDPDPIDVDGITVLSYEFSALAATSKSLADFFEGLTAAPKIILVEDMSFAQSVRDRRPPRLSIAGIIPVQIAPAGGS